jgi:hypothetical protein
VSIQVFINELLQFYHVKNPFFATENFGGSQVNPSDHIMRNNGIAYIRNKKELVTSQSTIMKMSATTRAAGHGILYSNAEEVYPPDILIEKRFDHGLCVTCSAKIFQETVNDDGHREFHPMTTPGVSIHGRCLYCHPEHDTHSVKEEGGLNWYDAVNVPFEEEEEEEEETEEEEEEEGETEEDKETKSLPHVIIVLHAYAKRFVGVVSEGNTKKGKGLFHHVVETVEHKDKLIVYEGEFKDGFFEGHGTWHH